MSIPYWEVASLQKTQHKVHIMIELWWTLVCCNMTIAYWINRALVHMLWITTCDTVLLIAMLTRIGTTSRGTHTNPRLVGERCLELWMVDMYEQYKIGRWVIIVIYWYVASRWTRTDKLWHKLEQTLEIYTQYMYIHNSCLFTTRLICG